MKPRLYPLIFAPVYKDYLWGGTSIPKRFNRPQQPGLCAESWELCDHADGMSIATNGFFKGTSLHDLLKELGADLVGTAAATNRFPLLIKIIDAAQNLSVQVHPDDDSAPRVGGEAKSEMWYILDGTPGGRFYAGLVAGTTAETFDAALANGTVPKLLNAHSATPGHLTYIRGGCVHAIGEGCLILEVQQNSNTTYRVYDWDRVGADGRPRELHIEKALQVIDWQLNPADGKPSAPVVKGANREQDLLVTPYFRFSRLNLESPYPTRNDGRSFHMLFVSKGVLTVETAGGSEIIGAGTTCLLPAAISDYTLTPETVSEVLRVSVV
ncbi:MAG: class I mannose-6-phosphate isomerase [Lentisphaerae bacterium]|nr:class I mannose-6-phosphate isomerase [Lentisphaerota bacterium]